MEQATVARYCGVHILDNPFSIDGAFHYYVPTFMAAAVTPGAFVTVPFGRGNRKQLALVVEEGDDSVLPSGLRPEQVKPVDSVCREKLFLSPRQLELCFHLKKTTLCTLGEAVRAVVPAQALASLTEFYTLAPGDSDKLESRRAALTAPDLLVLDHIRARGTLSAQAVKNRFGAKAAASLDRLRERELILRELTLREPEVPTVTCYALARPVREVEASLRGDKGAVKVTSDTQKKVLETLLTAEAPMSAASLREACGATAAQLKSLTDKGLLSASVKEVYRESAESEGFGFRAPFNLSEEQAAAVATLDSLAATGEPKADRKSVV